MRLYLAVAVLMLALVSFTEAQDDTVEQKLTAFREKFTEVYRDVAEKVKNTAQDINNSEALNTAKNWFRQTYESLRDTVQKNTK